MRRAWTASVCAASAGALLALGASSATALEIGRCVASPGTGKYKTSACTTKAGSEASEKAFEFSKNALLKQFKMAGGVWLLGTANEKEEPSAPLEWFAACSHQSGTGEYRETGSVPSTKQVQHVHETWTECEVTAQHTSVSPGTPCQSTGQPSGTIVSGSLAGKLGYIKKVKGEPPVVGLELHPEAAKSNLISFECGSRAVQVRDGGAGGHGCVIAQFSTPNEMSMFFYLTYSARILFEPYEQVPHAFQGSTHTCVLESNMPDPFLVVGGSTITNEEPLEIKG
jgi:hypothetical protein